MEEQHISDSVIYEGVCSLSVKINGGGERGGGSDRTVISWSIPPYGCLCHLHIYKYRVQIIQINPTEINLSCSALYRPMKVWILCQYINVCFIFTLSQMDFHLWRRVDPCIEMYWFYIKVCFVTIKIQKWTNLDIKFENHPFQTMNTELIIIKSVQIN